MLKSSRPDDYYRNAITVGWPKDAFGRPEHIEGGYYKAVVFKDGGHTQAAEELVRFLVGDGGLAQYLTKAAMASCRRRGGCSISLSGSTPATPIGFGLPCRP